MVFLRLGFRQFSAIALAAASTICAGAQQRPVQSSAFAAGSSPDAFSRVDPARTDSPQQVVTNELRGDIFMARKMFREAAEMYKDGATGSAVLLNKTGIAYHQMLELDLARKYYEKAVKANPVYPEAINNLGTIYYSRKSYRRAISFYKKALRYSPQSASIFSNLGTGYFARKDYKHAAAAFQQALELDPDVFERKNTRGILLQERSVEERAKFHLYLAKTYAKAGNTERALLYIRKALEEGLKERQKLEGEPEFATLKSLPEFQQLVASEPRVL